MRYPILIEEGSATTAFGIVVPDLPGCVSAGDSLDEALDGAKVATAAWVDAAADAGQALPPPSRHEDVRRRPGYAGWTLGMNELDQTLFDDSIERVDITLPRRVLRRLDDLAAARHQSRGAFIADLTMRVE